MQVQESALVIQSPKATILIVDDEPDVREVLEEYFVAHGYAALVRARTPARRATIAAAQPVDLALIDIHMPGEDGLSLARHLRERYAAHRDRHADVGVARWSTASSASRWAPTTTCPSPSIRASSLARVKSVLRRTSAAARAELGAERVRIGRCVLDIAAHRLIDENGRRGARCRRSSSTC